MSNISVTSANNFKSTIQSRQKLMGILSEEEKQMFIRFVRSVTA